MSKAHPDETVVAAGIAVVRLELERLPSVSRTWFEWSNEQGSWLRTVVVEVRFDTDPNSPGFDAVALDEFERTVREKLTSKTNMPISGLRVVPKPAFA